MNQLMAKISAGKAKIISLCTSAGAMLGACAGICGSACVTGSCGCFSVPLLGFLGLSTSMFRVLEGLRPAFMVLTVLSLVYAFLQAYRPKPAVSSCADCAPDCCGTEKKPFLQSRTFLWCVTVVCAALWLYPYAANALAASKAGAVQEQHSCDEPCDGPSPAEGAPPGD